MNKFFKKSYQSLLISGIIATALGIVLFLIQNDFIETLIRWAGFVFIVMGATFALIDIYNISKKRGWGLYMFSGVILIALGILFTVKPTDIRNILAYIIGIWAIISGTYVIIIILRFRKDIHQAVISIISGVLLIVMGVLFLFRPNILNPISNAVKYLLGAILLVVGLWKIFNSFRIRRIVKSIVLDEEREKYKVNRDVIEDAIIEEEVVEDDETNEDEEEEEVNMSAEHEAPEDDSKNDDNHGFSSTSNDNIEYSNPNDNN